MKNVLFSQIALFVGVMNWILDVIYSKFLIKYTGANKIFVSLGNTVAFYNLFLVGIVSVIMMILTIKGYCQNKNYVSLILNLIINSSYLIYYVLTVNDIIRSILS